MSRIAILSALAQEQHGLLALLLQPQKVQRAGRDLWLGDLHGHSVVLALSRIGKVAAATTATALIEHLAVTRILFTGVAGGLAPDVQVGDVVVANSFVQHDLDASPIFPRFELPLYGRAVLACDEILSALLFQAARDHLAEASAAAPARHRVHRGLIASGDRFVSAQAQSVALRRALQRAGYEALAVEMEGAAVAQVCLDYGVPFAAVRTISDRADDQAHLDFATFVREVASQYACAIIGRALRSLSNK